MTTMLKHSIKVALTAAALTATSFAYAEGEVTHTDHMDASPYTKGWLNADNKLEVGTTIQAIAASKSKNSYSGNPALQNKAWGMTGAWLSFEVASAADVLITLSSAASNAPSMTVYRTDDAFIGTDGKGKSDKAGVEGAVHSFNQVAQAGKPGLIWATDNSIMDSLEGNTTENGIVETLGYVNGSDKDYVNIYNDTVAAGAHDLSMDNRFENGVYGGVARNSGPRGDTNYANLSLMNLQPGHYTVFVGGADHDGTDAPIDVKVSALPLSAADCLLNAQEMENPALYSRQSATGAKGLTSESSATYYFRYYEDSKTYLGVSSDDNHLYSLKEGDAEVKDLGDAATLMPASCK